MEYIRLGEIIKTFGVNGQVKIYSLTSFPLTRFKLGNKVTLLDPLTNNRTTVTINYFRDAAPFAFLGFKEIKSINEAEAVLHSFLEISKDEASLPSGYYRYADLVGCKVINEDRKPLGIVKEVLSNSPVLNLRISREGQKDFFVPFLMKEFIKFIDIEKKEITIKVIPGLL
jgi:16S rRNA processing protein RimM